ncbi:unnamed protein product, partial [Urochloa humidicola]
SSPDLLSHPHVLTSFPVPAAPLPPSPPLPPPPLAPFPARRRPSRTAPSSFSLRRARVLAAGQSGPARWISPRPVLDRVPLLRPPCLAARSVSRAPLAPTADEARRINLVLATLPRHLRRRCEATDHNPVALASLYRRPPDPPPPPPVRAAATRFLASGQQVPYHWIEKDWWAPALSVQHR